MKIQLTKSEAQKAIADYINAICNLPLAYPDDIYLNERYDVYVAEWVQPDEQATVAEPEDAPGQAV